MSSDQINPNYVVVQWTAPSVGTVSNLSAVFDYLDADTSNARKVPVDVYYNTNQLCTGTVGPFSTNRTFTCAPLSPFSVNAGDIVFAQISTDDSGHGIPRPAKRTPGATSGDGGGDTRLTGLVFTFDFVAATGTE
jgi:hypothetical protein